MKSMRLMMLVICALMMLSCNKLGVENSYRIQAGEKMPDVSFVMNDGTLISSAELHDGPVLLVFFNTGCPDCRKELDVVQEFWNTSKDAVGIYPVSREEGAESILAYWKAHGYTMPFSAQLDRKVYERFSYSGIPLVVYAIDGVVVKVWDDLNVFKGELSVSPS